MTRLGRGHAASRTSSTITSPRTTSATPARTRLRRGLGHLPGRLLGRAVLTTQSGRGRNGSPSTRTRNTPTGRRSQRPQATRQQRSSTPRGSEVPGHHPHQPANVSLAARPAHTENPSEIARPPADKRPGVHLIELVPADNTQTKSTHRSPIGVQVGQQKLTDII